MFLMLVRRCANHRSRRGKTDGFAVGHIVFPSAIGQIELGIQTNVHLFHPVLPSDACRHLVEFGTAESIGGKGMLKVKMGNLLVLKRHVVVIVGYVLTWGVRVQTRIWWLSALYFST